MEKALKEIGETAWIKKVIKYVDNEGNLLSNDDDAVAYQFDDAITIINTDTFVSKTDRPQGMSLHACGYKAVIASMSDIFAKGGEPKLVLASLGYPNTTLVQDALQVIQGIKDATKQYNTKYAGGDTSETSELIITITVVGSTPKKLKPIPRHGNLQVKDEVYWFGCPLGSSASTLEMLQEHESFKNHKREKRSSKQKENLIEHSEDNQKTNIKNNYEKIKEFFFYPKLPKEFLEVALQYRKQFIASIDSSDGIARSLFHLISKTGSSKNSCESSMKLNQNIVQTEEWITEFSKTSKHLEELIFYGGEEYGIVCIIRNLTLQEKKTILATGAKLLGRIVAGPKEVIFNKKNLKMRGWEVF